MNVETFGGKVQRYLRSSGYSQKQLAVAINLHPKVLSRKLNGSGNAFLSHLEVRCIIKMLACWQAISTQDEVIQLLELAQLEPTSFSDDEWQTPPLNQLTKRRTQPSIYSVPQISTKHNLPAATTRLVGRELVLVRLQRLLERDDVRLVTLVGSGGSGKTRLALQVARQLLRAFEHGVWFVALAGVNDPEQVPMSILQALHISPTFDVTPLQSLITYLRNRHLLLVLDNFEHLGEAADVLDKLLAEVAGLKVLITSRMVLRLYGEHEFSVPPLDVPEPSIARDPTELSHYGAIQLFVERAQAAMPDFALTAENAADVVQICARVDGLPLALELAAARIKVLPPSLLLERLSQSRLPVLIGGARNLPSRQQTLRNTIKWSYDLLSKVEQAWFARLGVFTGGWSLEAAEVMMQVVGNGLIGSRGTEETSLRGEFQSFASTEGEDIAIAPVERLAQLVDNSLLVRLPANGQARFAMLETLREYALERLDLQGECELLRDWHACYYLSVAEAAEKGLRGPQQVAWLAKLTADRDNFRAAFAWALQRARESMSISALPFPHAESRNGAGNSTLSSNGHSRMPIDQEHTTWGAGNGLPAAELCLRLASALRHYWEWQGNLVEARSFLGTALDLPPGIEVGRSVLAARAKALSEASRLACLQNDQVRAVALAEESIALAQELDDPIKVASAYLHRGWAAQAMSDYETAVEAYQRGLASLSTNDDPWLRAQLLFHLAAAVGFTGRFEQMRLYYSQGRKLFEQLGDKSSLADLLKDQGAMSLLEGNCIGAIDGLLASLKMCYELGHKQHMTTGMCWLSLAIGMSTQPDLATAGIHSAQLEAMSESLEEIVGLTGWTKTHQLIQVVRMQIRSNVDEQSWQEAWATGRKLTIEQAIDLASRFRAGLQT